MHTTQNYLSDRRTVFTINSLPSNFLQDNTVPGTDRERGLHVWCVQECCSSAQILCSSTQFCRLCRTLIAVGTRRIVF